MKEEELKMTKEREMVLSFRHDQAKIFGCEVMLDYNDVQAVNKKRCPYFYGVEENGNNASFELTYESWEQLEKKLNIYLGSDNRFNVFENGKCSISTLWYNGREEEWVEEKVIDLENSKAKEYVDYMLAIAPICRKSDNVSIGSYEELLDFLKKGDF
jgi:hypothetical protein